MALPPLLVFIASLFLILLTDSLERVGAEAAPSAAVAVSQHHQERKAQGQPVVCGLQLAERSTCRFKAFLTSLCIGANANVTSKREDATGKEMLSASALCQQLPRKKNN